MLELAFVSISCLCIQTILLPLIYYYGKYAQVSRPIIYQVNIICFAIQTLLIFIISILIWKLFKSQDNIDIDILILTLNGFGIISELLTIYHFRKISLQPVSYILL